MKKTSICWFIAILITLFTAYYQRISGPTYPKKINFNINNKNYSVKLPRSYGQENDCEIVLKIPEKNIKGKISYRRYPINESLKTSEFIRKDENLIAYLPRQPKAGKLLYYVELYDEQDKLLAQTKPIIIRFRGSIPTTILILHIIIIFLAMLFSNLAGLLAIVKDIKYKIYSNITLVSLIVGGLIFGAVIQKYAFGKYWTGIPFGWDLTDNKTLIAILVWIIAIIFNRKQAGKDRPYLVIIASIITLLIYLIPHSLFGSEYDYATGKVIQACLL